MPLLSTDSSTCSCSSCFPRNVKDSEASFCTRVHSDCVLQSVIHLKISLRSQHEFHLMYEIPAMFTLYLFSGLTMKLHTSLLILIHTMILQTCRVTRRLCTRGCSTPNHTAPERRSFSLSCSWGFSLRSCSESQRLVKCLRWQCSLGKGESNKPIGVILKNSHLNFYQKWFGSGSGSSSFHRATKSAGCVFGKRKLQAYMYIRNLYLYLNVRMRVSMRRQIWHITASLIFAVFPIRGYFITDHEIFLILSKSVFF